MPKTVKTPSSVLNDLMDEYRLNPYSLSLAIKQNPTSVRLLVIGKSKITVPIALRLARFFGQSPAYWLELQYNAELNEAGKDKKLTAILKGITKAKKPPASMAKAARPKGKAAAKPLRKSTLRDKRKKAAKAPGARAAKGRKAAGKKR